MYHLEGEFQYILMFFYFLQYYNAKGMPTRSLNANVCAVCGNKLLTPLNEDGVLENTYKLSCGHVYPFIFHHYTFISISDYH